MHKALDMGVDPESVEASHRVFTRIRSEAIQALGINAPGSEKQERKITDEIDGDEAQTLAIRRLAYAPRRRAVDLINKRYFNGDPVVEVVDQW